MKRILSILGTITLIATSTTSLIACKPQYSEEQLKELKEENKININGNTLEGIAPQEKPFNTVNNKGYVVIWRGDKNADGRIAKFKNNTSDGIKIDNFKNSELKKRNGIPLGQTLCIEGHIQIIAGEEDINNNYFKSVYRGEGKGEPDKLVIDPKTGKIIDGK